MTPSLKTLDVTDVGVRDAELFRQLPLANPPAHIPDCANVIGCQFGVSMAFATGHKAHRTGVAHILDRCRPFEVNQSVVFLNPIDMVHPTAKRTWFQECLSNQAVNIPLNSMTVSAQRNKGIETRGTACCYRYFLENPTSMCTRHCTHTPHAPEVADFVPAFKTNDGFPLFGGFCDKLRVHWEPPFLVSRSRTAPTVAAASIITQIGGA